MQRPDFGIEPKLTAIPDLRTGQPEKVLEAVKQWIEVRQGSRGDGMDRAVTVRDLLNSGIAEPNSVRGLLPPGTVPIPTLPSTTSPAIPPTPTNLVATGAIENIMLSWTFTRGYTRLAYFEVWRASTDVIGDAVKIGQPYGELYVDAVGPGMTFYYWVRAVSDGGASPYNALAGTVGTTAMDPVETMRALLLKLGYGDVDIAAGVFPITTVASRPVLPNARYPIGTMVMDLSDGKLYRNVGNVWVAAVAASDITGQMTNAQIADLAATKISGQLTNAQIADIAAAKLTGQITSTQITDNSVTTPKILAGAVTTAKVAAGAITAGEIATNAITATHVSAGAIITGKIAAGAVTAGEIAANAIVAGKIAAAAVDANALAANSVIAGKLAAGAIVAGDAVISNAAIGTAALQDAVITSAKIGALAVDNAKIANVNASKLTAGQIGVAEYIESTNFLSGSTGFRVHGNGNCEFWNGTFRGVIGADSGLIGGNTINSTGVQSPGYNGTTGWRINSDGSAIFGTSVTVKGVLSAATGSFAGSLSAATGSFAGSLSAATGSFAGSLSAATGSFAGSLSAATGTFSGTLTAAAINAVDTLNVAGNAITGLVVTTAGADTCGAGSSRTLSITGISMPASSAGVLVTATISLNAASSASANLSIWRGGTVNIGGVGVSLQAGFASVFTFQIMDLTPGTGSNNYYFFVENPSSGPGSNVALTIASTSVSVQGAKR